MDASAYLTKQGWRGTGHALDAKGHGLARPLLVAHKSDNRGVGKKKHNLADQWWSKAFDESLQSLAVSKEDAPGKTEVITTVEEPRGIRLELSQGGLGSSTVSRGHLYTFFQRGESLQGTIGTGAEDSAALREQGNDTSAERKDQPTEDNSKPDGARTLPKKKSKRLRRQENQDRDLVNQLSTSSNAQDQSVSAAGAISGHVSAIPGDQGPRKRKDPASPVTLEEEPSEKPEKGQDGAHDGVHPERQHIIDVPDASQSDRHGLQKKSKRQEKEKRKKRAKVT